MSEPRGKKFDAGKPMVGLLPTGPLLEVAKVLTYGAQKYDKHNWRQGIEWSRLVDAVFRHTLAWKEGEDVDPETGISHLAHAVCGLLFLLEFEKTHPKLDDRYKPQAAKKI